MKRVWKPLDYMGLRLYEVRIGWENMGHIMRRIVAAKSPSHAARIIRAVFVGSDSEHVPNITANPLSVNQPEEWFNQEPAEDRVKCKHGRTDVLQSSRGTSINPDGAADNWESVSLCLAEGGSGAAD